MSKKIRTADDRKAALRLSSRISNSLARVIESYSRKRGGLRTGR